MEPGELNGSKMVFDLIGLDWTGLVGFGLL